MNELRVAGLDVGDKYIHIRVMGEGGKSRKKRGFKGRGRVWLRGHGVRNECVA